MATTNMLNDKASKEQSRIEEMEEEYKKLTGDTTVNVESLINKIVENNLKSVSYFDSISLDIPKNVWLTSYYNKDGEDLSIEGMSLNIGDIYNYFKNLKALSPTSTIKLNKLKMITDMFNEDYSADSVDSEVKFYTFEIGNASPNDAPATVPPEGEGTGEVGEGGNGEGIETPETPEADAFRRRMNRRRIERGKIKSDNSKEKETVSRSSRRWQSANEKTELPPQLEPIEEPEGLDKAVK